MTGFIGAATLLGILVGALVFGALTDRLGRRIMMIVDLAVFVVASLLQGFAANAGEILALRFILGVAIGADFRSPARSSPNTCPHVYGARLSTACKSLGSWAHRSHILLGMRC